MNIFPNWIVRVYQWIRSQLPQAQDRKTALAGQAVRRHQLVGEANAAELEARLHLLQLRRESYGLSARDPIDAQHHPDGADAGHGAC